MLTWSGTPNTFHFHKDAHSLRAVILRSLRAANASHRGHFELRRRAFGFGRQLFHLFHLISALSKGLQALPHALLQSKELEHAARHAAMQLLACMEVTVLAALEARLRLGLAEAALLRRAAHFLFRPR